MLLNSPTWPGDLFFRVRRYGKKKAPAKIVGALESFLEFWNPFWNFGNYFGNLPQYFHHFITKPYVLRLSSVLLPIIQISNHRTLSQRLAHGIDVALVWNVITERPSINLAHKISLAPFIAFYLP